MTPMIAITIQLYSESRNRVKHWKKRKGNETIVTAPQSGKDVMWHSAALEGEMSLTFSKSSSRQKLHPSSHYASHATAPDDESR